MYEVILRWEHLTPVQQSEIVKSYSDVMEPWELIYGFYHVRSETGELMLVELATIH